MTSYREVDALLESLVVEANKPAVQLLQRIINGIVQNPNVEKYRRLKVSGKAFAEKLLPCDGAIPFLYELGFTESSDGEWLEVGETNINIIAKFRHALNRIDELLSGRVGKSLFCLFIPPFKTCHSVSVCDCYYFCCFSLTVSSNQIFIHAIWTQVDWQFKPETLFSVADNQQQAVKAAATNVEQYPMFERQLTIKRVVDNSKHHVVQWESSSCRAKVRESIPVTELYKRASDMYNSLSDGDKGDDGHTKADYLKHSLLIVLR